MKHSESLSNIAPAIKKAQGEIRGAIKDSKNPFFKSNYADLESCWEAVKEPLQANGLSVVQTMGFIQGAGPTLITTLLHMSGEYITGEQPVCAKSDNPQEMGSAITYARRYGLSAIVGLIQVDDDAEGAMNPARKPKEGASPGPTGKPDLKAVPGGDPGAYVIQCNPFKGKRLDEIEIYQLNSWVKKWEGKEITGVLLDAITHAEPFLKSREVPRAK